MITRGSLLKGLQLRLEHGTSVEDMRVGRFVVIEGERNRFFCLVTDMELGAASDRALLDPPSRSHPLVAEMLEDIATFSTVSIQPMLMLPREILSPDPSPSPASGRPGGGVSDGVPPTLQGSAGAFSTVWESAARGRVTGLTLKGSL